MANASTIKLLLAALAVGLGGCGGGYGGSDGGGPPTYTVGGTVAGLNGTVVLRNNGADDLTVSASGVFAFKTAVAGGGAYSVTVQTQPSSPAQDCVVASGSGIANANVTNVAVTCSTLANAELQADAGVRSATLTWTNPTGAATFNVYASSARDCDIQNIASCPDGKLISNALSPHVIGELRNGQAYFFRVETVHANGARGLSNEAGARPNVLAFNGRVQSIATGDDGTVYLGGNFTQVGITTGAAVPLDVATGNLASPDFPMVDGDVHAVAADGTGGWYLGGFFTQVGGVPRANLAHVLPSGMVDPEFDLEVNHAVRALAVSGNTVYVGGSFGTIDGLPRSRLAAIDANGVLKSWDPVVTGSSVLALALSDSTLYVGGEFTHVDGQTRSGLAAFSVEGALQLWNPVASGFVADGRVHALAVSGDTVFAGGWFIRINGVDRNHIAAIGASGGMHSGELQPWNPDADSPVFALAISDNTIYAGGLFTEIGGAPRERLAALDASGVALSWSPRADDEVSTLAVSGSTVYAGGSFGSIDDVPRRRLAAINVDGTLQSWNPAPAGPVAALAVAGSTVYAGGSFRTIGGVSRARLAAIDPSGALRPWNPRADGPVHALAMLGDTVYAGGAFTQLGGASRRRLAAIDSDGVLLPWDPVADNAVHALTVSGSTVYVGGEFGHVGSNVPRQRLAAIHADGTLLPWDPVVESSDGSSNHDDVFALAVFGGTVYAGGSFGKVDSETRNRLAALDAGGSGVLVEAWKPDVTDGDVLALAVSGNTVYAGGRFRKINGDPRDRLAAIGADGTLLRWNPGASAGVNALAVSGGTVYAGGDFLEVGGAERAFLAAISADTDTSTVLPWNPDILALDITNNVSALAIFERTVYVGGFFPRMGKLLRPGFAAVSADDAGDPLP